ncbi:kek1.2 family protein [Megaselia abdita]
MPENKIKMLCIRLVFVVCLIGSISCSYVESNACESDCTCKWRNGKQTVECRKAVLTQIPDVDATTQVLDVSENNFGTLTNGQFIRSNLLDLQKLYMRKCRISEIEFQALKGLTNLVELDLSHNLLLRVPSEALGFTPSLRDLNLGGNHILKIGGHAFQSTPALHKLDISNCGIHTISPHAFEGNVELNSLKINGNKLTELRTKTIDSLNKLHNIELYDNPWICDCRLRSTKIWFVQKNVPYTIAPRCSGGPERVLNRTFAQLQLDDFACQPEFMSMNRNVQAFLGENTVIDCRASAVPSPTIRWYLNGRQMSNGSVYNGNQRIFVFESGLFEKKSRLILTNTQEIDEGDSEVYCVVENNAGAIETNFTLIVLEKPHGFASLEWSQLVGLTAAIVLILCIIFVFMCLKVKASNHLLDSKTPHLEVVTQNAYTMGKNGSIAGIVIANNAIKGNLERKESFKFTDVAYDKPPIVSPTDSLSNNPDLINDTKKFGSGEFSDLKIPACLTFENYYTASHSKTLPRKHIQFQQQPQPSMPQPQNHHQYYHTLSYHHSKNYNNRNNSVVTSISVTPCGETQLTNNMPAVATSAVAPSTTTSSSAAAATSTKTIRVWQKGAVPVLPPVNALKRTFNSNNSNSPDEGYQEGYATDV